LQFWNIFLKFLDQVCGVLAQSHSFYNSMSQWSFDEMLKWKARSWLPHLFKFIIKFINLLLHVLQIFPIFDILPFNLLKLFLITSELIILSTITSDRRDDDHIFIWIIDHISMKDWRYIIINVSYTITFCRNWLKLNCHHLPGFDSDIQTLLTSYMFIFY
jgi:hypothetical protein